MNIRNSSMYLTMHSATRKFFPPISPIFIRWTFLWRGKIIRSHLRKRMVTEPGIIRRKKLESSGFFDALKQLKADSFTREQPSQKEEISLTVYLDNDNYPKVQMDFYRYDGNDCLAVVDGTPVCLVARNYVWIWWKQSMQLF